MRHERRVRSGRVRDARPRGRRPSSSRRRSGPHRAGQPVDLTNALERTRPARPRTSPVWWRQLSPLPRPGPLDPRRIRILQVMAGAVRRRPGAQRRRHRSCGSTSKTTEAAASSPDCSPSASPPTPSAPGSCYVRPDEPLNRQGRLDPRRHRPRSLSSSQTLQPGRHRRRHRSVHRRRPQSMLDNTDIATWMRLLPKRIAHPHQRRRRLHRPSAPKTATTTAGSPSADSTSSPASPAPPTGSTSASGSGRSDGRATRSTAPSPSPSSKTGPGGCEPTPATTTLVAHREADILAGRRGQHRPRTAARERAGRRPRPLPASILDTHHLRRSLASRQVEGGGHRERPEPSATPSS